MARPRTAQRPGILLILAIAAIVLIGLGGRIASSDDASAYPQPVPTSQVPIRDKGNKIKLKVLWTSGAIADPDIHYLWRADLHKADTLVQSGLWEKVLDYELWEYVSIDARATFRKDTEFRFRCEISINDVLVDIDPDPKLVGGREFKVICAVGRPRR